MFTTPISVSSEAVLYEPLDPSGCMLSGNLQAHLSSYVEDELFEVFGITRSLPKKGCPFDNAVDESTNKTLKAEFVYREQFSSLYDLQVKLSDYVCWCNNDRMRSTPGCMNPVEFRKAGLSL